MQATTKSKNTKFRLRAIKKINQDIPSTKHYNNQLCFSWKEVNNKIVTERLSLKDFIEKKTTTLNIPSI